jgi:hypothetical protein
VTPAKTRQRRNGVADVTRLGMRRLLDIVGIHLPRQGETGRKSLPFWVRYSSLELDWLLKDAHKAYRRTMKRAHTDAGGSKADAVAVNAAWREIRRRITARVG